MSGQEADTPNKGEVSSHQEVVGRDPDRRVRTLSRKALENEIDQKHREANVVHKMLKVVIRSTEDINEGTDLDEVLRDLEGFSEELNIKLQEIRSLYAQDKYNYFGDVEVRLVEESLTLERAIKLIQELKSRQSDKLLETSSRFSRHSHRSKSSAGSSRARSARMKALAEAAAARESADYEKMVAEKEHERKQRETEIERTRQQEQAEHAKELAIIAAEKKVAIAHAKLKAIEQAINEEENEENAKLEIEGIPKAKSDERTSTWVHSFSPPEIPPPKRNSTEQSTLLARGPERQENTPLKGISGTPRTKLRSTPNQREDNGENSRPVLPQSFIASTPINITGSQLIESLTSANQQIVSGLARQNLPKCHPDTFSGDPTLFHPWKAAFKAMISDVNVYPVQEINYLRSFTSGEAQKLVDNYRKRKQHDPGTLLNDLWGELERRFGSAAVITKELLERLNKTAAFSENENAKLQEFADLCTDVDSQLTFLPGLACLNFPNTIQPIAEKLPLSLRGKWEKEIARYSEKNGDKYPGFRVFSQVVLRHSRIKNNPNILAGATHTPNGSSTSPNRRVQSKRTLKTNTGPGSVKLESAPPKIEETKRCSFHERGGHNLEECKAFGAKPLEEKTDWILKAGLCYRCLSEGHRASDCSKKIQCSICKDDRHIALLHKERPRRFAASTEIVDTKCTLACKPIEGGVSCSKLLLVDVKNKEKPNTLHRIYAIVDEQSNSSLISSELADELGAVGPEEKYLLTTCSGEKEIKYGRRVAGVTIQALNGVTSDLPTLIECDSIPHDKREIPTPEMARRFPHLHEIAGEILPLDPNADIHLLLGRDAPELLKVREFKNGPKGAPWAQKLSLGWTIIGQMCLDIVGGRAHVLACRTSLLSANNGEPWKKHMEPEHYELIPCPNQFRIKESLPERRGDPENDIFRTTREDNDVSLSCEDRKFIEIMETGINKNDSGNWEMPLPFRHKDTKIPNNRSQAVNRLNGLIRTLRKKPQMEKDYLEFMQKILDKGHASPAQPANSQSGRVWYLPHFGVYHPKKPTQIRVVFDSSAEFGGVSLNKELLPGPDLMNSLLGVLIRFRKETTAVMCDIEQMFRSFHVDPSHRNFLRFLWFEDNTPGKPITEYRMNVHLFGNGPSPAVATFGLRRTASDGGEKFGKEAAQFVRRNFYVDDGLASLPTGEQAVALIKTTQAMLATANLRLHKIVSNSVEVMEAFPTEDRGKGVRDLDLHRDSLPAQRSLGVYWDLEKDNFTFQVSPPDKPFTRRGVLSIVNSVYDPLGLAAPVLLEGRLLLQQLVAMGKKTTENRPLGWDDPLPDALLTQWQRWRTSLNELEKVSVPRCYRPVDFGTVVRREIHAFSDASENAIGAAIYLRQVDSKGNVCTALLLGQSKVAPLQTTSIPRLELCAAVLAAQAVAKVIKEIDMEIDGITFYTDSKVVLGYIQNESRRFYVYVANRVQLIRKVSSPNQWRYMDTNENPADLATRRLSAQSLAVSDWFTGPRFLQDETAATNGEQEEIPISEDDPEVRKEVSTFITQTNKRHGLGANRFSRFSSLSSLQRAIANLIVLVKEFKRRKFKTR